MPQSPTQGAPVRDALFTTMASQPYKLHVLKDVDKVYGHGPGWVVIKPDSNPFCRHNYWSEAFACAYGYMTKRKFCRD
jgi:hypothetical protein